MHLCSHKMFTFVQVLIVYALPAVPGRLIVCLPLWFALTSTECTLLINLCVILCRTIVYDYLSYVVQYILEVLSSNMFVVLS
jgi:hypothetical protein